MHELRKHTRKWAIPHPALIMIRGLPGSGKSYVATGLQQTIGSHAVAILDPDQIDTESQAYKQLSDTLTKAGIESKFFPNRFLKAEGCRAISDGKVVIWNQAFTDFEGFRRSLESLQNFATSQSITLPTLVVEVEISHNTAKTRIAMRAAAGEHNVSTENFARFINDYTSFADKGFPVVSVNGEDDVSISVATILDALQALT